MNLDCSKATPSGNVSVNILKSTVGFPILYITNIINLSIEEVCFCDELKLAEVTSIFNEKVDLDKQKLQTTQCFTSSLKGV